MQQYFDRLRTFVDRLTKTPGDQRHDVMMNEVIENGGIYVPPTSDGWSAALFEISLHSVVARGTTEEEAIESWRRAAQRMINADEAA